MQSNDAFHIYERLTGEGSVYLASHLVGETHYELKDVAETTFDSLQTGAAPKETRVIFGYLRSKHAAVLVDRIGQRLMLRLQNGRALEFNVVKNLGQDCVLIQCLNGAAIAPDQ